MKKRTKEVVEQEMVTILRELSDRNDMDIVEEDLPELDEEACHYLDQEEEEDGEFDLYRFNHDDICEYYDLKKEFTKLKEKETKNNTERDYKEEALKIIKSKTNFCICELISCETDKIGYHFCEGPEVLANLTKEEFNILRKSKMFKVELLNKEMRARAKK